MLKENAEMQFMNYLFAMTDDTGIFQHSKYGVPDRNMGYTTDDNARALILAVMLYERFNEKRYMKLIYIYLSFVHYALNNKGMFKNFMNYQREFIEVQGSEDCFGRCIWALGRVISSKALPKNIKNTCIFILDKALENVEAITFPRAKAYTILGLSYLKNSKKAAVYINKLAEDLAEEYRKHKDKSWCWFEDCMTYGNAILPWSLFRVYKLLGKEYYLKIAEESMNFLQSIVMKSDFFKPVGCNGWLTKGMSASAYDEQPIEACEMICAYIGYYEVTKDKKCLSNALKCFNWYKGGNSKKLSLIDKETGACYDGITEEGLNLNQGSESIISYGMSVMEALKIKSVY